MRCAATQPLSTRYRLRGVLDFRILGPLEVVGEHGPLRLGGPKQRATLAILLLNANRVVSVDRLADDLYSGAAPVTAVTQVQRQISELRKALGDESIIETRPPGYVIRLEPGQLDLHRFERLAEDAGREEAGLTAELLRQALGLWRGAPLADLAYESFAQPVIERLEEIRLAALEQRIDAELALGQQGKVIAELEQLVAENPLHERFRAQLMLALYRSGRQADALEVYRRTRERLVGEFGIEPTAALRELERTILAQDRALELVEPAGDAAGPDRVVLVLPPSDERIDRMLGIAQQLAMQGDRELIVVSLVPNESALEPALAALKERRKSLPAARTAAFTSLQPGRDAVRLARVYNVDLILGAAPPELEGDLVPEELGMLLDGSPADVALLAFGKAQSGSDVFVPFGGGEHDWAALELGAWFASAIGDSLYLVGTTADRATGRRDASRLLADASLAAQRVVGVETRPLLAEPTDDALLAAVEGAALVVVGISPRWRREGIGATRRALVRGARPPVLLVHRGPRPSGLAPHESRSRFTWTIEA
jgi:DNA-binding SARP family transcriptional activator